MQIKSLAISNLSSFIDFASERDFEKCNLIFGTNGSGKSTLVKLLQHIGSYAAESEEEEILKVFLRTHVSKEATTGLIDVRIAFQSDTSHFQYDTSSDLLAVRGRSDFPIWVFNDDYTNRNISQTIEIDLPESGLVIGETNIEMENLRQERDGIEKNIANRRENANKVVADAASEFKEETGSQAYVGDVISIENLLRDECDFDADEDSLERRKRLGFETPEKRVSRFEETMFKHSLNSVELEKKCTERVLSPSITEALASVLKEHTLFFQTGIALYNSGEDHICPFCRRPWEHPEALISAYHSFLESDFSSKRSQIEKAKAELEGYRAKIIDQQASVNAAKAVVDEEGKKYDVDTTGWLELFYSEDLHDEAMDILNNKFEKMEDCLSIKAKLDALQQSHVAVVKNNNLIIKEIEDAISSISTKRKQANAQVLHHIMHSKWASYVSEREEYEKAIARLSAVDERIQKLEEDQTSQDTVQTIFNSLLEYIGLTEYFMDSKKRLNIRLGKDSNRQYDISKEGNRISTAQRKILSLCYFFADVVSRVKRVNDLDQGYCQSWWLRGIPFGKPPMPPRPLEGRHQRIGDLQGPT